MEPNRCRRWRAVLHYPHEMKRLAALCVFQAIPQERFHKCAELPANGPVIEARFHVQDEKLYRVEEVIGARLKHLEERFE